MKLTRTIAALALAASVSLGVTACTAAPASETISVSAETVIIDVRTADEFDSGHLEGAINLDVQSASFDALAAQLPTDGDYVVYCRSGNRSAAAIERLQALGFTSLTNAGGLDAAATATGLDIVR
ncbi:rhodanese-like domain-containing protein [Leifsonia sp. H3M29-4]|uniref:rhodanese-like domain-containing protein n=1 Tax=Salinibacterium metalliresistens TaxID=3031321 RepID=UPI0023DC12FF|nr:rhodanese-like domain-containing protein [Salinibacterium metalliresistens]MDF1478519.1 rhodanese-like domain-containing protein [Salinibacterium metalliresistens]